jgi:sugar transferase EpsL
MSLILLKRFLDLSILLILLPVWLPSILMLGILVRLGMGTPVLFCQTRIGKRRRPFKLYKFRTMTSARDSEGNLLPDSERLTEFGRWLRSTSLDELPELFNVIKGDMSLVGPRPLLIQYLDRYTPEQARRHEVLPGVTGLAQVCGRNEISWKRRLRLDVWYVDHLSLQLDLKILRLTIMKTFRREGINLAGHSTMPEFEGKLAPDPKPDRNLLPFAPRSEIRNLNSETNSQFHGPKNV